MKILMVTGLQPYGHYSTGLCQELAKKCELVVLAEKDPRNLDITDCGKVVACWSNSPLFILQILLAVLKHKVKVVHLQHEIRMYGSNLTAALFPLLLVGLRLLNKKVITTVHAVVAKDLVKSEFIHSFKPTASPLYTTLVKLFFSYLYKSIYLLSHKVIIHVELLKEIYISDYNVPAEKFVVLPIGVNTKDIDVFKLKSPHPKKYFWYYGYLVKRKGLQNVINGFKAFLANTHATDIALVLSGGTIQGQEFAADEIKELVQGDEATEHIKITGYLNKEQIEAYAVNAYATIVPALFTIAGSGPLGHLFSFHKCVMASNVGCLISELDKGKTGLLVENDKWAEAFERLYKNPHLVHEFELKSKEKADRRRWSVLVNDYLKLYATL